MPKLLLKLLIISVVFISGCKMTPTKQSATIVDLNITHPVSPSLDSVNNWCKTVFTDLEMVPKNSFVEYDSFSSENKAFSGWACQVFQGNARKYKFNQIKNGKSVRQVSYFVNGAIESDIYLDWSQGFGSERSWMADGKPYIENYYSSPGIMHGLQRKWFSNSVLSKESLYNKGVIVYEVEYNRKGELISSKGVVPLNKKN